MSNAEKDPTLKPVSELLSSYSGELDRRYLFAQANPGPSEVRAVLKEFEGQHVDSGGGLDGPAMAEYLDLRRRYEAFTDHQFPKHT